MSSADGLLVVASFSIAAPALLVMAVLSIFKRRARARRRSPLVGQLLRSPGHTLRGQVEEAHGAIIFDLALLLCAPMVVLYVLLGQTVLRGLDGAWRLVPILAVGLVAFVGFWTRRLYLASERLDALRLGHDAEVAVAQQLDELVRKGAVVFHDFPAENFNIDHVVIARQGVFAIETKGRSKAGEGKGVQSAKVVFDGQGLRFPRASTQDPIEQAKRQALWLSKWLSSATGNAITTVPVVALPGWFVERKARGAVRVYSGGELAGLLNDRSAEPLSAEVMTRVVHEVDQRCRDVKPLGDADSRRSHA